MKLNNQPISKSEQLGLVSLLESNQRRLLSDMCRGAQVLHTPDGVYRSCIEIAGGPKLSAYFISRVEMKRLNASVSPIQSAYMETPQGGYEFYYLPAGYRESVAELLTLTLVAPALVFGDPSHRERPLDLVRPSF